MVIHSSTSVLKILSEFDSLPTAYSCSRCPPYNISAQTTVENSVSNSRLLLLLRVDWLKIVPSGTRELRNYISCSVQSVEFLEEMGDYWDTQEGFSSMEGKAKAPADNHTMLDRTMTRCPENVPALPPRA
jgi:hypothetical protein